jgi:hypothetical protein
MRSLLILPLVIVTCSALSSPGAGPPNRADELSVKAVKRHLEKKYSGESTSKNPRLGFDPAAEIVELDAPLLRKHLPGTRFYRTRLKTSFLSYWEVEMVVAATVNDGKITTREGLSPVFTPVSKEFLGQFLGIRTQTAEERRQLAVAIAELLQKVTYKGELHNARVGNSDSSIQLWTNGRRWRDIVLQFDSDGRVSSVTEEHR